MDTYYTIEEKYLQAVDEVCFGKTPRALQLLKEIIDVEPFYARAHYQLGKIYYYDMNDYQTAGYHFKTCLELEPAFPDVYYHYLSLIVMLNMEKLTFTIGEKALKVPGVNAADIYELLGLFFEKNNSWKKSLDAYQKAFMAVTGKADKVTIEESLERVKAKVKRGKLYQYHLVE